MGITTSKGVACDFQGPYSVGDRGRDPLMQYIYSILDKCNHYGTHTHTHTHTGGAEQWDKAIAEANAEYRTRMHNICCDNCHSHVAYALNNMEVKAYGIRQWDMVKLCFLIFLKGRFLSLGGFLAQFLPFGVVVLIILLVKLI
ncbi:hypothetical protein ACHAXM_008710 [Skeletonema potamos]